MKLSAAALLGLLACTACSFSPPKLVFLVDPHWPPMEFLDNSKSPSGYDIDLVRALAREAGFTPEFKSVPWEGLFAALDHGDAIVSLSVVINTARSDKYGFSEPYLNAGQVLVVPQGSPARGLNDVRGPVGVQTGTRGAEVVARARKPSDEFPTIDQAFGALAAGRVAAVVADGPAVGRFTLRAPQFKGRFSVAGPPLTDENFGLVVKKGNQALLERLNAALARVKAAGVLEELAARWLR